MPLKRAEDFVHRPVAELIEHLVHIKGNEFGLAPSHDMAATVGSMSLGESRSFGESRDAGHVPVPIRHGALPEPDLSTLSFTNRFADREIPVNHPPVSIANVQIEAYVGGGSFGCVYAGRIASTGLVVAVKVLRADNSAKAAQSAVQEALIAARVRHRNIMGVFDVRQVGDFWIVLMEFIQGFRFGWQQTNTQRIDGLRQLADAISTMKERVVVHRDIKPDNIVVRRSDNSPVIVDFGLAVDLKLAAPAEIEPCGTPLFMPPEAFLGSVNPSFDAYALGVTAFVVLVGNAHPWKGSMPALIEAKKCGDFETYVKNGLASKQSDWRCLILELISADPQIRLSALEKAVRWPTFKPDYGPTSFLKKVASWMRPR